MQATTQATTQGQYVSHWELVSMQARRNGVVMEEVQLTEADKTALTNWIRDYRFTEKEDVDDEDGPIICGGLQIRIEFLSNGIKYVYHFTSRESSRTVLVDDRIVIQHQYEVDTNLWYWIKSFV